MRDIQYKEYEKNEKIDKTHKKDAREKYLGAWEKPQDSWENTMKIKCNTKLHFRSWDIS